MGRFVKGEVVVIPFPYSDLTGRKRRPAVVVTQLRGDDVILCQITSINTHSDDYSIPIDNSDFISGSLKIASNIRPNRLFTADSNLILECKGLLANEKVDELINCIMDIIHS